MDFGINEKDFWNMTIAELGRLLDSKKRILLRENQQKAIFDYKLADLIGRSVSRLYSSNNKMPSLEEVYSDLFNNEEIQKQKQVKKEELSMARFKQFAQSYNEKFEEV